MSKNVKITLLSLLGLVILLTIMGVVAYYQTPTT